jgi:small basic protein
VLGTVTDPLTSLVLGTAVGAPSALVPHAAKAAVRTASTTVTGGLANPLLSVLEDAISIVTFVLAVLVPLVVVAALGLTLYLASRWLRRHRATALSA